MVAKKDLYTFAILTGFGVIALASCGEAPSSAGKNEDASTEPTDVDFFRDAALRDGRPIDHVTDLANTVGPRLAGSEGDAKAVAWAEEKMRALGFANVRSEAVTVPHWERGAAQAVLVGPTESNLAIAALGGSIATPVDGLEAEILAVTSVDALSAIAADRVAGKIVFFDTVMERTMSVDGYARAVASRRSGPAAAARKGAVAAVVRSMATSVSPFPHTGDTVFPSNVTKIPAAAVSVADALVIEQALTLGAPVRVRLTLGCRDLGTSTSANVIGEVTGAELPDEIVLLGAHLDSWDLATGAIDDGAGVAMALEAGRLLGQWPTRPRRTVRVVLYANEEFGTSGANAYVSAHQSELAGHVMAIEADLGDGRAYAVSYAAPVTLDAPLAPLLTPLGPLGIAPAVSSDDYGADVGALYRAGVPVAEIQQDLTTYFDFHHSAEDTIDKVNAGTLTQATAALAVFGYQFSHTPTRLRRAP